MAVKLIHQSVVVDEPVPSLPVYEVRFADGGWTFVYRFKTPARLTTKTRKEPLYFTASLLSMELSLKNPKNTTNLEMYCLQDLIDALNAQRKSDIHFRERFKQENKDFDVEPFFFTVENKTQKLEGSYIVSVKTMTEGNTSFIGRR